MAFGIGVDGEEALETPSADAMALLHRTKRVSLEDVLDHQLMYCIEANA